METETRNGTWPLNTQSCHDCRLQGVYNAYVLLPVPFSCGNIRYERAFLCPDCAARRATQGYPIYDLLEETACLTEGGEDAKAS